MKVGDTVVVTAEMGIARVDGKTRLSYGVEAEVIHVYDAQGCQIVDIAVPDKLPLCDIVCFPGDSPLKVKEPKDD